MWLYLTASDSFFCSVSIRTNRKLGFLAMTGPQYNILCILEREIDWTKSKSAKQSQVSKKAAQQKKHLNQNNKFCTISVCLSPKDPEHKSYLKGVEVKQILRSSLIQLSDREQTHPSRQGVYYSSEIHHLKIHQYQHRLGVDCIALLQFYHALMAWRDKDMLLFS